MTQDREKAYLTHIIEMIELIPVHMQKSDAKIWYEDVTVRDAVLRTLQIMAESCTKLLPETKEAMQNIPWRDIAEFRNVIAHDYLGDLDYDRVNYVFENNLAPLGAAVKRLYEERYDRTASV